MEREFTQFVFKYWFQCCWWALEPMLSNIPLHVTDLEFVDEQNSNGLLFFFFVTLLSVI
jgi:hypothetical protein